MSGYPTIDENRNVPTADGVEMSWRLENKARYLEGLADATVGGTRAFFDERKHLLSSRSEETLALLSAFRARHGILPRLSDISLAMIALNFAAAIAFFCFGTIEKAVWAK